jgi:hypothetical protein
MCSMYTIHMIERLILHITVCVRIRIYCHGDQLKCTVGDTVINLSRVDPRTVPHSTSRSELSYNHLPAPFPSSPSSCRVFWEGSHRGGFWGKRHEYGLKFSVVVSYPFQKSFSEKLSVVNTGTLCENIVYSRPTVNNRTGAISCPVFGPSFLVAVRLDGSL